MMIDFDKNLLYSDRTKLADDYEKYIKDNPEILDCPLSFVTWLYAENLLDVEKVKRKTRGMNNGIFKNKR